MRRGCIVIVAGLAAAGCADREPSAPAVTVQAPPPPATIEDVRALPQQGFAFVWDDRLVGPADEDSMLGYLSEELLANYELILYIDKSEGYPLSQTLTMIERQAPSYGITSDRWQDQWHAAQQLPISTGREQREDRGFTETPVGIFNFDSRRFYRDYSSILWDGAPMPNAMFLEWPGAGVTGVALHGTEGISNAFLGQRASGGCIRLEMSDSDDLFTRVTSQLAGPIPSLRDRYGRMAGSTGQPRLRDGHRVLIVIDEGPHVQTATVPGFEAVAPGRATPRSW